VVQRSRAYARETRCVRRQRGCFSGSKSSSGGNIPPEDYGRLLEMLRGIYPHQPLFTLPMYYPLAWYKGADKSIDPLEEGGRQSWLIGRIFSNGSKFRSSVRAVLRPASSKLWHSVKYTANDAERAVERWNPKTLRFRLRRRRATRFGKMNSDPHDDSCRRNARCERLDRKDYDVAEMMTRQSNLDQMSSSSRRLKNRNKHDDKLQKLIVY